MNKPYLTKTALSALCLGLSLAATHTAQADTWTGGVGKFEDPTKWGLTTVPASSAQEIFVIDADGDHCTADATTWQYLVDNSLLQNSTTYRGVNRALFGNTAGAKTMSFTLDIGDGNMFQLTTNADNWIAERDNNDVTLNVISGTFQTGKRLRLANTDTSSATVNLSGGRIEVGRDQLILGTDSATPPEPLFSITGGSLTVRTGLLLRSGTLEIQGSSIGEITLGANGEGYAEIDGTIRAIVDAGGITPIISTDDGGDGISGPVTFEAGSELDVSFLSTATSGTWTILEREGGPITDNGLAFAAGVDTGVWSFAIDNSGANGKLTVTANVPLVYWNGNLSDDWDIATTFNWLASDETTASTYTEPTEAIFDDFLTGSGTVNLTTTFSDVNVVVDTVTGYTFSGIGEIAGNAALTKNGTGTLTVSNSGSNNFDAGITVNGGAVILDGTNSTGSISLNDTALTINGSTSTSTLNGTATSSLEIGTTGDLTVTGGADFSGALTGDGAMTIDNGANAQITYNAATTYSGSILVSDGTLTSIYTGGAGALATAAIQLGDASDQDATLYFPTRGSTNDGQVITVVGGGNNLIWGSHNHTGQTAFIRETVLVNADLTIRNTGGAAFRVDGGDANGGLYGTGNVTFQGNNVNGGNAIAVRQPVNNIGTITNNGIGINPLNFVGSQGGKIGVNVTGIIQDSATSAFEINATSDFTGTADIIAGTLRIFDANGLDENNLVSIDTAGILDVQNNVTVGGLVDGTGGAGTVTNDDGVNNTLNIGGSGTHTFSGLLEDGTTNLLGISKGGTGSQTLTGVNTYLGLTSINEGTLVMGNLEAFGASATLAPSTDIEITTVTASADVTVAPGTKITVGSYITSASIPADTVVGAYDSTTGIVTLSAAATADATETATFNGIGAVLTDTSPDITVAPGTPIYAGMYVSGTGIPAGTRVNAYNSGTGIVTLNANATSTSSEVMTFTGAIALNGNGILDLNGLTIADNFSDMNGTFINSNTSTPAVISNEIVGLGYPTFDGAGDITVNNIRMTSGVSRRITKNGTGTLTLAGTVGNNRYGLTVNEGDVFLNKPDGQEAVSRFPLIMNNVGSTVTLLAGNQIHDNPDANGLHEINAGTLDLNGFDESIAYLSTTNGTETDGVVTNSDIGTTSTLTLSGAAEVAAFPGVISGNLNLVKNGANAQTLSGTNTYTGTTSVNGGSLVINGANSSTSLTSVASAAAIGGSGSLAGDLTIAAGGLFIFSETDTLSVAGAVTLDATFGIDDLVGISSATADGTYTLIDVTATDFSTGFENIGIANEFDLGSGKFAYFQNGSLQVVVYSTGATDDYSTWATDNGITGELPGDDFENDGLSNLLEYALGKNPTVADGPAETSYDGITVVYTKGADAIANGDVSWAIEESDDLGLTDPWAEVVTQAAGDATATISHTLPTKTKVFVRLKVTEVAP